MLFFRSIEKTKGLSVIFSNPRVELKIIYLGKENNKFKLSTILRGKQKTRRRKIVKINQPIKITNLATIMVINSDGPGWIRIAIKIHDAIAKISLLSKKIYIKMLD